MEPNNGDLVANDKPTVEIDNKEIKIENDSSNAYNNNEPTNSEIEDAEKNQCSDTTNNENNEDSKHISEEVNTKEIDSNKNEDINNENVNKNTNTRQGNAMEPEQFRKVFIGGLSYKTDDETLKGYFSKYGELVDYVVMKDSGTGRSRGFGFVTYAESYMVDELMKNRPHIIDGRQVEPKRATPREDSGKAEVQMTVKKLFIGGLRDNISEDDLRNYFNQYGTVLEAVIMKEKESSKSRGFGFVTFDDYDPVDKIILEKHHAINGVNVHTQKALPKDFEKGQNTKPNPQVSKHFNNSQSNNHSSGGNYHNYNNNANNSNGHGNQYHHNNSNNQNMPNLNTLAQMAASFFAAASANKNMPKSNMPANNSMVNNSNMPNNPNGNRSGFDNNFSYSSNQTKSMNMNNQLNNPINNMNYLMNQFMNHRGPMNMPNGGSGGPTNNMSNQNNKLNTHMNNPGPMRGGHGRFANRSGPYNTPTASNNFSSNNNNNMRGRMRGGNRNMNGRFNNNNTNGQLNIN